MQSSIITRQGEKVTIIVNKASDHDWGYAVIKDRKILAAERGYDKRSDARMDAEQRRRELTGV